MAKLLPILRSNKTLLLSFPAFVPLTFTVSITLVSHTPGLGFSKVCRTDGKG